MIDGIKKMVCKGLRRNTNNRIQNTIQTILKFQKSCFTIFSQKSLNNEFLFKLIANEVGKLCRAINQMFLTPLIQTDWSTTPRFDK